MTTAVPAVTPTPLNRPPDADQETGQDARPGKGKAPAGSAPAARSGDDGSLATEDARRRVGYAAQSLSRDLGRTGSEAARHSASATAGEAAADDETRRPVSSLLRRTAEALYSFVRNAVSGGRRNAGAGGAIILGEAYSTGVDLEA
ncbi:hypothetical protein [Pararhodospirillum oryzae]|uniref:hypothetical protein n=1 Tax=Pararhodospirillum oryzae TaxID=478448 RepID=UPI0011BF17B2|nr:hypothetical protein [Pararhodospirillum oryzae]